MQTSKKQRITTKHEVSSYYKKNPFEISHGGDRTNWNTYWQNTTIGTFKIARGI